MDWPGFGPERDMLMLSGLANTVPDFIGPIDGSAMLTIFTEGNHYPALLPIVMEQFPAWCAENGGPEVGSEEILAVTLPQVMIVDILERGGVRLGNAVLHVAPEKGVYPDVVMAGVGALERLAAAGVIHGEYTVFTRHKGMGLLLRRGAGLKGLGLHEIAERRPRVVLASVNERRVRDQYTRTLEAIIGQEGAATLLSGEVGNFPGRLAIQHRDVPYALLRDMADVGIIFGHLARFYAETYPERLAWLELPQAEPFGQEIAMAATRLRSSAERDAFLRFFPEAAKAGYPAKGFAAVG
ncbi:MAG: hypothetical protein ACOCWR_05410 [Oceanidesulfovibrio sp.]